jgi:hypothetical protein
MRVTTYAYPWDVARIGVRETLGELADAGIQAIDLASTYHPIDSLSPRGGARLYTDPRGAVHFPARAERYGRIHPHLSSPEITAAWPAVADHAASLGIAVNAWTVTLFQPWIIDAHPSCARVLPGGDAVGSGVCPANDDVREYLAALCADMVDQFDLDIVRLEGLMSPAFDFDWLRPRTIVTIAPLARELLAICFCSTCVRRGVEAGLDVERLRATINETVAGLVTGLAGGGGDDDGAALAGDAELRAFVLQHERASLELIDAATSLVPAGRRPRLSATAWSPFSVLVAGEEDALLEALAGAVDQAVLFPGWFADRNETLAGLARTGGDGLELGLLVTGLRPGDERPRELQEAIDLGVTDLSLYNWGLHRAEDVRAFMAGVRAGLG